MMETNIISNSKKEFIFWKKKIIHFVNVETDPRLLGEYLLLRLQQLLRVPNYEYGALGVLYIHASIAPRLNSSCITCKAHLVN
jgi:hypothetical protein